MQFRENEIVSLLRFVLIYARGLCKAIAKRILNRKGGESQR